MTGAEAILKFLKQESVEYIFGLPGTCIMPLLDFLAGDHEIKFIGVRHEQVAAHMAEGYARASGKLGVVLASRGPGAANTMIGMVSAHPGCAPVMLIAGQAPTGFLGRGAFEEFDLTTMFAPVAKYCYQVERAAKIPEVFRRAVKTAFQGRPGPVMISVPLDILREKAEIDFGPAVSALLPDCIRPDAAAIEEASEILISANKPAILAGNGLVIAKAWDELRNVADGLGATVATSYMRPDAFPSTHPLHRWDREAVASCDALLVAGSRLSELTTDAWTLIPKETKVVQIDQDPEQVAKAWPVEVGIVANLKIALAELGAVILAKTRKPEAIVKIKERCDRLAAEKESLERTRWPGGEWDEKPIRPWRLLKELREASPRDAIFVFDSAALGSWARRCFDFYEPGTCITSIGGSMGFGLPGALGVKLACPQNEVVCVIGDGSFMMVMSALDTMVNYGIPITVVINNNSSFMQTKFRQKPPYLGSVLKNPDFAKVAELFGARGIKVEAPGELKSVLTGALGSPRGAVIDVITTDDPKYATPETYFGLKPRYLSGQIPGT